ncbi:hypothetical protein ACUODJ_61495, partial [Escherichia sp. HC-CC]
MGNSLLCRAFANVIKEILYRAAERMQMPLVLVANQS